MNDSDVIGFLNEITYPVTDNYKMSENVLSDHDVRAENTDDTLTSNNSESSPAVDTLREWLNIAEISDDTLTSNNLDN